MLYHYAKTIKKRNNNIPDLYFAIKIIKPQNFILPFHLTANTLETLSHKNSASPYLLKNIYLRVHQAAISTLMPLTNHFHNLYLCVHLRFGSFLFFFMVKYPCLKTIRSKTTTRHTIPKCCKIRSKFS